MTEDKTRAAWSWTKRITAGLTGLIVILILIAALGLAGLNTSAGRDFVKDQVEALEFENGLKIGIGSLDGSLYSDLTIRDLTLSDPRGVFASAPLIEFDWNPFAFINGHIDIAALTGETATLARLPEFTETPPSDAPLLPDYDIDVSRFAIDQFVVEEAITGAEKIAELSGEAHVADGRAQVVFDGTSLAGPGGKASGDAVNLLLDAVPAENQLSLSLTINAPKNGIITALAGLPEALVATLKGKGDWKSWDGELAAQLGSKNLADINLTAREGTFAVKGDMRLGDLAPEAAAPLLGVATNLDIEAALAGRTAQIDGRVFNDNFNLAAIGLIDLSNNSFSNFRTVFALLEPAAIAPGISGSGLRAQLTFDGKFASPEVQYTLDATRILTGDIGIEGFNADGDTKVDLANMTIPLSARADRIVGLDTAAGGPLRDITLTGDLLVSWPRILSDNVRLQSRRIDAQITVLADAEQGRYAGALDGKIDNYRLESVGLFGITSDIDLEAQPSGDYALKGSVKARSTQLTNESVADFLGGDLRASSDVSYGSDGTARFSNLRLSAPAFTLRDGRGSYSPGGEIDLVASARSDVYGPLGFQLAGTIARPVATIKAASPGLGIGLADLTATIRGDDGRYAILAEAVTDYGPLSADMTADLSRGPIVFAINEGDLSGIGFSGKLRQAQTGPFIGALNAKGRGLAGIVKLDAEGAFQTAAIAMRSTSTTLPGPAQLTIGRGIIDANVILYEQPKVIADFQLADASYFGTRIDAVRAQIDYQEGAGTAKMLALGGNPAPFRIAANAKLESDLWRAAIDGNLRGIAFNTAAPARIIPGDNGYELLPTRINVGEGSARIAGEFGEGVKLQSRLENIELKMINAFSPGLGINGTATGSLDFVQANEESFPRADARLRIRGLTRSTATSVSEPLNVNLVGQLQSAGGAARAVIRQGGAVIGRLNTSLTPLAPGAGSWTQRLLGAPLGGGIRFNGPAEAVFSLAGQDDQELTGSLGIAADFSGQVAQPVMSGIIRGKNLKYDNLLYGTQLADMSLAGRFDNDQLVIEQLDAAAGDGTVEAAGSISLAADRGFPMDIRIKLNDARLARSDALSATATGDLAFVKRQGEMPILQGTIQLPEARYKLAYPGAAEVPELSGVRFKPLPKDASAKTVRPQVILSSALQEIRLDLALKANEKLYVSGMGLESEWSADLRITGTSGDPRMAGKVNLVRGTLGFAGRSFDLNQGSIRFNGGREVNPTIAMSASEQVEDVAVNVNVTGRAYSPEVAFSSTPGLPQDEIISRILFGSSVANLSPLQAVQLAGSLNALRGGSGGLNPLGTLRSATGVDRLRILGSDEAAGRGTAVAAGQYITDDVYIEVITDARGFTATQLEISLTPTLSVLSQAGGTIGTNVNLRYRRDY